MSIKYECQDMYSHEVIATFNTYDEADNFMDAAYDMPDWWTVPAMTIVEVPVEETGEIVKLEAEK
ncbi:hypothetical protein EFT87_14445 [Schleiferilactobacillus harbinensis]|uniref:hypothetical protein n=1 Tax=Schleiferilactobacillus harbinensis TaxID=304207 RepID=UPI0021A88A39|nr:hypothetical protein [Schleiferilactobacillus harbinensis]MCT2909839.1 hypothetical protein [Schleiferilactobacillus harbinensis]